MEVIRLKHGQDAPEDEDRVRVTVLGPEASRWGGSIAFRKEAVFKECPDYYPSREAAEKDALEWAETHGVETLYIEVDDP